MGFVSENCLFAKLSEEIIKDCAPYQCSEELEIDAFFHLDQDDNFVDYNSELMGFSYCCYTEESSQLVSAFSLSNSVLRTGELPKPQKNAFNRKIPNAKRRSHYPALLIGRFCVFDGFRGKGVGTEILDLIKLMALSLPSAARYLVVDALNNEQTIHFYTRNGFVFLFPSEEEEADRLSVNLPCKTRLMFFDLIVLNPKAGDVD